MLCKPLINLLLMVISCVSLILQFSYIPKDDSSDNIFQVFDLLLTLLLKKKKKDTSFVVKLDTGGIDTSSKSSGQWKRHSLYEGCQTNSLDAWISLQVML